MVTSNQGQGMNVAVTNIYLSTKSHCVMGIAGFAVMKGIVVLWFSYVSGNVVQSDTKYIFFSKTDPRDFSVRNRVENRAASRVCPNSRKFSVLFLR